MVAHYGSVNGNGQAGAVTYFGFLSFFPILALGFFVVGQLARIYPAIQEQMAAEIDKLLPGVVGTDSTQIQLDHRQPRSPGWPGSSDCWACCTPASAGCRGCGEPSR